MNKTLNLFNGAVLSLTLIASMPSTVFAASDHEGGGTGAGNGGDAVVCRDSSGKILSVEFFDLFEARVVRGKEIVLLPSKGTVDEKVAGAVAKIANYFPRLAKEMIYHSVTFLARAEMVSRDLEDIPDAGDIVYPSGCRIEQAIIRSHTLPYPGKNYVIDARLWNRMNADSRAAAILHEFTYGIAVDHFKHINSVNARRLNAELLSKPMPEPGALVSWVFLFKELKLGFDEPFGCLEGLPGTCGSSPQVSLSSGGDSFRVSGTLTEPMPFYFQGEFRTLAPGAFTQWNSPVALKGEFLNSETFRTSNADIKIKGGFSGGENGFTFKNAQVSFATLTSPTMTVKADPSCEWQVESGSFSENSFELNSPYTYGGCIATIEYRDENQTYSITDATPEKLSPSGATVKSGILNWKYGKDIAITRGITIGATGASNSFQEIGRVPELLVLGTVIKNVPISTFYFYNSAYYFASPVSIDIKLRDGVGISGTIKKFEENQPLEGKFRFTRLDGFSSEYLQNDITKIRATDSTLTFDINWGGPLRGEGISYIKKAYKIPYKDAPIEISLLDAFNFRWDYSFRIPKIGTLLPQGECHTNYPTTESRTEYMPIRIEFTKEGMRKYGTRTAVNYDSFFLKDKYRISFESCLKSEGLVVDKLDVEHR